MQLHTQRLQPPGFTAGEPNAALLAQTKRPALARPSFRMLCPAPQPQFPWNITAGHCSPAESVRAPDESLPFRWPSAQPERRPDTHTACEAMGSHGLPLRASCCSHGLALVFFNYFCFPQSRDGAYSGDALSAQGQAGAPGAARRPALSSGGTVSRAGEQAAGSAHSLLHPFL